MLRSFRLANHRSIADEQELLLMPARQSEQLAVPVTAIYGANASGKSNVISGLEFMRAAVLQSFSRWEIDEGVPRNPFRLNPAIRTQPSLYVAELVVDGVPYTYGFSVDDNEVLEEWLYSYPEKRRRLLFSRQRGDINFGTTLGELKPKLAMLEELTRPNALFLSAAAKLNLDPLLPVYQWFRAGIRLRSARHRSPFGLAERIQDFLAKNPGNHDRLVSLLAAADVGITNVSVEEADELEGRYVPRRSRALVRRNQVHRPSLELRLEHGVEGELFGLGDESDGTLSWLELLPVVLDVLDEGSVVAVDEIDTSLHPLLTAQLVELFQDTETNPRNAQLIFTTHDTSLLGTMIGNKVLDRDQIWFVQKNNAGATELYPLTDFKPRQDQNLERRYLGGSYGAVPVLDHQDFVHAVRDR
ncbi:ATP/GTP-binding protein [Actinophytocola sp. NPDC049390]|uniref:ATP/GTP-binding protein n=1 Tax=Actinophytocola sp. NPDC049390 TaxID=3363894 RepID=UPI0037B9E459